jgi:UDP-glucuronate 4-epimerase
VKSNEATPVHEATPVYLVTGAAGCLGAWVVRQLLDEAATVVTLDVSPHPGRLRLLLSDGELDDVRMVVADIAELSAVTSAIEQHGVTRIIHCAALQVPFVKADPSLGARVNVQGTVNVFEAARLLGQIEGISYASSAAVFGPPERYPGRQVEDGSSPMPYPTLYGVFKLANEWTAQHYAVEYDISSTGLRPFIIYGPGRDQGLTSGPSVAMLAAAAGRPWHIPYGGYGLFQFAPDVADAMIQGARSKGRGIARNVNGVTAHMEDVVAAIEAAAPDILGRITFDDVQIPSPARIESVSGSDRVTPLSSGVARTIQMFRELLRSNRITAPSATSI